MCAVCVCGSGQATMGAVAGSRRVACNVFARPLRCTPQVLL